MLFANAKTNEQNKYKNKTTTKITALDTFYSWSARSCKELGSVDAKTLY